MTTHDSHCHFFSTRFFEALGREKFGATPAVTAEAVAEGLGWEAPGEPLALAARWVAELDRAHVSRAALIASIPGDEDSVAVAVAAHPDRFVGFFVREPRGPGRPGSRAAGLRAARHAGRLPVPGPASLPPGR